MEAVDPVQSSPGTTLSSLVAPKSPPFSGVAAVGADAVGGGTVVVVVVGGEDGGGVGPDPFFPFLLGVRVGAAAGATDEEEEAITPDSGETEGALLELPRSPRWWC